MKSPREIRHFDVIVVGAGTAGVIAALAAARNGARTALVESSPFVGGLAVSGLPLDGYCNSMGENIVGGISDELLGSCRALGGYVDKIFDWRTVWAICADPEILKLVLIESLAQHRVSLFMQSPLLDVALAGERVEGVVVRGKEHAWSLMAKVLIDCTGDGDLAVMAGAEFERGGHDGELQPVSLVFRMGNTTPSALLEFARDNPEQILLAENPVISKTKKACAEELYKAGKPFMAISAEGELLRHGIDAGRMFPCTALFITPVSMERRELAVNATRVASIDGTNEEALGRSLSTLTHQVRQCIEFLCSSVPGFSSAHLASVWPKVGVRETRRIKGEALLTDEAVLECRKLADGIAKGGHHIDVHGRGKTQQRVPIRDGGSYDIPLGCLIPRGLENVLVAGRCLSSTRGANGSARVMGTCMAMGQAAGTAAALAVQKGERLLRHLSTHELRRILKSQGAILDGTH